MRVMISGGTGMIGSALAKSLLRDHHQVWVLTRDPQTSSLPDGAQAIGWDGHSSHGWGEWINRTDAVVNLVGERLAKWPWTGKVKQRFLDSRVNGGQALVEAIRVASHRPQVFIQASGVNFYGPHGQEVLTESAPAGDDFLGRLSRAWEESTRKVEELGMRRAVIRTAIVLHARDGILPIMMLPVRFFAGGPLGNGRQGLPWIHLDDETAAIRFLLENEKAAGPFNLTVPRPVSSGEFLRTLASVMRRPYWLPAPAFALRLILGGMSELVLSGQYLVPERLLALGFRFKYEDLAIALGNLLK